MSKTVVITKEGKEITLKEWQKMYQLPENSTMIGRHFSTTERIFARDLKDYGTLVVNEQLMRVMDRFRDRIKKPVNVNAFNRNEAKQAELAAQGLRTATHSPHVVFMAVDIDTTSALETREFVRELDGVAKELGIKIRIGYEDYLKIGQTFVHVDVCPEYYAKGKPFNNHPHPVQWESPIKW